MASSRKAAIRFIFLTLLIDVAGLGLIIPVMPKLIESMIDGNISTASQWGGWLTFAYAFMQFICAPIMGGLSDRYGRRPVLLLSLLGNGSNYLIWRYQYDDRGLRVREAIFDKYKQLTGKIEYQYQMGL